LIQGFAADAEFTGQLRFLLARRDSPFQFGNLFTVQGFLSASVGSALLGERDAFALPLADQGPLELGERAHDSIRFAIGESSPVKVRLSLTNSMRTPRSALHEAAQVIEVARQRSMLCTTTVSPSRTKASSLSSSGRWVSLPDALSVNTLPPDTSSCRSGFWSKLLTRT
jgi:hypothetical protein